MNSSLLQAKKEDKAVREIQELIRGHSQSVRNWGYFSQVNMISKELYSYFDPMLTQSIGVSATNIIDTFLFMIDSFEESLTERWNALKELKRIKKPKELVYKYYELIDQGVDEAEIFIEEFNVAQQSCKNIFIMLLSHYDLRMADNYLFNAEQISKKLNINIQSVRIILDNFSCSRGELSEYQTDYIFLDNPIWNKPIIKLEDEIYFCPIPQLFFSFIFTSLDGVIQKVNKKHLHKRRAEYLEEKIEEIVKRRFPEALTVSGIKWMLNNVQYETDLITFIDSHVIIFEAKSHNITKSALRGAPDRIKRHFKEIFIEPSIQSKRLEQYLNKLRLNPDINSELREQLPVDLSKIHQVLRVSISLEDFATVQANISKFNDTGWIPENFSPCPSMNLADFETLFDLLEHPVQIIHYLKRRTEMEGEINFVGDELDFMGFYMTTLFNMGNIHDENPGQFVISQMSLSIDNYYMSKDEGIVIDKPQPKISKLFKRIFSQLEKRNTPQWTEIGVILNRFSPDDQLKLESYFSKCKKIVNRTWQVKGHNNTIVLIPPSSSEYALAYLLYKDENANRRNEFIENAINLALEPEHVSNCLVIAKNIDHDDLPYNYIALVKS
jgi:hypothetical protein